MSLCAIFDNPEPVSFCNRENRIHVRRLTAEMNRNDSLCAWCNALLDAAGTDREIILFGITKHHVPARLRHRLGARNPGMRASDHFVSSFHTKRTECDVDRVGSVAARDAVFDSEKLAVSLLEFFNVAATDESRFANDRSYRGIHLFADCEILRVQINEFH